MLKTIRCGLLCVMGACASYPEHWIDPGSATGVHDDSDADLVSYGGDPYRVQWRGDPEAPEQSLWRLRGAELGEQVVPWGPWAALEVTDDRNFFALDREAQTWFRCRPGEPPAAMVGWDLLWTARADGFHGHYVRVEQPSGIVRIDAEGRELARFDGADNFEMVRGGLLLRRGTTLLAFVDRELQPRTTEPPVLVEVVGHGRRWLLKGAAGVDVASCSELIGETYADVLPIRLDEQDLVRGFAVRVRGEAGYRLADGALTALSSSAFAAIDRATVLRAYAYDDERRQVVVVRGGGDGRPFEVVSIESGYPTLGTGADADAAIASARQSLYDARKLVEDRARAERQARLERMVADKEQQDRAARDRAAQARRDHRQRVEQAAEARRKFHAALVAGGIAQWEIDRYDKAGVPMVVVGGKAYAGSQLAIAEDERYERRCMWDQAPECFLWWDRDRWRSALKVDTGDGVERVLCDRDGRLQALQNVQLGGKYIVQVAAAELLQPCGRCSGDGTEQQWAQVAEYDRVLGWHWAERKLQVGTLVKQGHFGKRRVFKPGTCRRCWGHGVVPHLPE